MAGGRERQREGREREGGKGGRKVEGRLGKRERIRGRLEIGNRDERELGWDSNGKE